MPPESNKKNVKRISRIFSGVGIAFTATALTVGVALLLLFGIAGIKNFVGEKLSHIFSSSGNDTENIPPVPTVPGADTAGSDQTVSNPLPTVPSGFVSASFSDLFSGVGWINEGATSMYQDQNSTAFTFPPIVSFESASLSQIPAKPDLSKACLGASCLEAKGEGLFLDGKPVSAPFGSLSNFYSTTLGTVGNFWVVGTVAKSGGVFLSKLWRFDGKNFSEVSIGSDISSNYPGFWAFVGDANDWVAVYGAYEGLGYQFRSSGPSGPVSMTNISHLFGTKVMAGGLDPQIMRNASAKVWYVANIGGGRAKFFKLFEDGSGNVSGLLDLTDSLREASGQLVSDYLSKDGSGNPVLVVDNGSGAPVFFRISDKGFSRGEVRSVQSRDINQRRAEVREATITQVKISGSEAYRLYLSNTPGQWLPAEVGKTIVFPDTGGAKLFWRADFPPVGDGYTSPFFSFINVEYKLKFLN